MIRKKVSSINVLSLKTESAVLYCALLHIFYFWQALSILFCFKNKKLFLNFLPFQQFDTILVPGSICFRIFASKLAAVRYETNTIKAKNVSLSTPPNNHF